MATLFVDTFLVSADDYIGDVPDWYNASVDEQDQALRDATNVLSEQPWLGYAMASTQSLAWPRLTLTFYDPVLGLNVIVDENTVPIRLAKATAFLALHFIRHPEALQSSQATFDSIKVGPIQVVNSDANRQSKVPLVPATILSLIKPLLSSNMTSQGWWRNN